ncbi:integrase core domain-containing protein [Leptospira interrogans]
MSLFVVQNAKAKRLIEDWKIFYNSERPHSSLGGLTPEEYLRRSA